jgi:hypothetical protein
VGCSTDTIADYGAFNVTITNKGTTDITNIELSMVGDEEMVIVEKLAAGKSTDYQIFELPRIEGERPESWSDYVGSYIHSDTVKDIIIMNYEHDFRTKVIIEIRDHSYVTIFPLM